MQKNTHVTECQAPGAGTADSTQRNAWEKRLQAPGSYGLLFVVIALVFWPVVVKNFAFSDDYYFVLDAAVLNHNHLWEQLAAGGRPIYGMLEHIFYLAPGFLELRCIRLISIAGIIGTGWLFSRHIQLNIGISQFSAACWAAIICLMPPFQVYATWTVCGFFPWATLLSGLSFYCLAWRRTPSAFTYVLSLCLMIVALMIYQPAATFFMVFFAVSLLGSWGEDFRFGRIFYAFAIYGAALGVDFLATKYIPVWFFNDHSTFSRTALVHDIPGKLSWFFSQAINASLNFSNLLPDGRIAIAAGIFAASGVVLFVTETRKSVALRTILLILLVPASYFPNLVVQENWASYRTQVGLTSLLAIYFLISAWFWLAKFRLQKLQVVTYFAALVFVAFSARWNVVTNFIAPQQREILLVRNFLNTLPRQALTGKLYLVPSQWQDSLAPIARFDEFGIPSSTQPWSVQGMIWLIAASEGIKLDAGILNAGIGPHSMAPKNATVIDFHEILKAAALQSKT